MTLPKFGPVTGFTLNQVLSVPCAARICHALWSDPTARVT